MSNVKKLREERTVLRGKLNEINEKLVAGIINELIFEHAIDFKEQEEEIPAYVAISFEDEYDDEGGTDAVIDRITFFDQAGEVVDAEFSLEEAVSSSSRYRQTFYEKAYDQIQKEFDIDELRASISENQKIPLN